MLVPPASGTPAREDVLSASWMAALTSGELALRQADSAEMHAISGRLLLSVCAMGPWREEV
eukprot:5072017-Amphidinium_carterae.1